MSAPAWPQVSADQVPRDGDEFISDILVKFQQKHKVPGCCAAVVTSSGISSLACCGWRKRGDPTPVTLNDQWHLGSDTKQ